MTDEKDHPYEWALRKGPIGTWRTHAGTFDALMWGEYTFTEDGKATYKNGGFSSFETFIQYRWKYHAYGSIRLLTEYVIYEDADHPKSKEYGDGEWDPLTYTTTWFQSDVADRVPGLISCLRGNDGKVTTIFDRFDEAYTGVTLVA